MLAACGIANASGNDVNENPDNNLGGNTDNNPDSNINENGNEPDGGNGSDSENGSENGNGSEGGSNISNGNQSNLADSPDDILNQILDALNNEGINMPMALPPQYIEGDISQNAIGLSEADYIRLVVSAYSSQAAIGTFAHQIILIQAKDAAAAAEIKNLVSGKNGYDATKWICVMPQSVVAVDSGEYVMIVASRNEVVDAVLAAFITAAGTTGDVVKFFEFVDDGSGNGLGGGMAPMLPIGKDD